LTKSVFTPTYARFRELLIEARQAAGLTQAELAARLQRPQSYVSKFERGERRLDVVEFLEVAQALDKDPFGLLRDLIGSKGAVGQLDRK
jgi:transcriptional regulator with XRE-family HTH domain